LVDFYIKDIMPIIRLDYENSCYRLQANGYLEEDEIPPIPHHLPQCDDNDEPRGIRFFRYFIDRGEDFSNLTLPRTFFGRSHINNISFQNTDLSESNLCWNDFTAVNFTDAILARSDLRASDFVDVKFISADLTNSDLRISWFQECDFNNALMNGTILTFQQGETLDLTDKQRAKIAWTTDDGVEPDGG
jgi:BTB/POZ domain-containing protein KCTD9